MDANKQPSAKRSRLKLKRKSKETKETEELVAALLQDGKWEVGNIIVSIHISSNQ
jgi:hypothetical protein